MFIRQAIINVLHNAIKFAPPQSEITVDVRDGGGRDLAISVRDNGPGIAAEDVGRVFDRFYRCDNGRSRGGGFGLGLAISQWAVRAHGGTFWWRVRSVEAARFASCCRQPSTTFSGVAQHCDIGAIL